MDKDERTPCQQARELVQDNLGYWGALRESMSKEEAFLDGERYVNDNGAYQLDRRLIQIKGQETQDTIRHLAARATERPRSLEPRPVDQESDPADGEIATALVERELSDTWKDFDGEVEAAIISCREKRLGVVWMDWEPDIGRFGEIVYRYGDPRRIMWDPSYQSPHHPLCGWLLDERRVEVSWIHAHFKKSEWVQPDRLATDSMGQHRPGIPLIQGPNGERMGPGNFKDNKATLWLLWYKNDPTRVKQENDKGYAELPPGERYMVCKQGCGYRSPTEAALAEDGYPEMELPDFAECPRCDAAGMVGTLQRIDAKADEWDVLAYSRGKRLVIMAPFSAAPEDKPLYDGNWPIPTARSFPVFTITAYVKPGRPVGPCDTTLMWDQQIASDNLRTAAVDRVLEHRAYFEIPAVGLNDANGHRWQGRDDQFNIMIRDNSVQYPSEFKIHNATGLDPGFAVAFSVVQDALTQYRGMHDQGPVEERSKAKSGVALQTENAIGEIPVEHFNRRKNRELSKFSGVVWDYIRATYTPERLARLRMDGIDIVAGLQGDDLPNYDFQIEDTPAFTGLEKARAEAWDSGVQIAMQMPQLLEAWGRFHNVPKSVIRELEKAVQPPPLPGMAEGEGVLGDGMEAMEQGGLNGGGMQPAPVA